MKLLLTIYAVFVKIGAFTFGGGYAMLPLVQKEVIEKRHWATEEEVMDYYAMSQSLPGIIAVNMSLFLGYKKKGVSGGIAAALGAVTPSLVIIMLVAMFLSGALEYELVQKAFAGVRVVVSALIVQAIVKLWKTGVKGVFGYTVYFAALALVLSTGVPIIAVVLAAVAAGIVYSLVQRARGAAK